MTKPRLTQQQTQAARRAAAMNRQAVDDAAAKYWEEYFGDYGKQWVREIPRKIKAELASRLGKSAATGSADELTGQVYSLNHTICPNQTAILEGVFRGKTAAGQPVCRLFTAKFAENGRVTHFEATGDLSKLVATAV